MAQVSTPTTATEVTGLRLVRSGQPSHQQSQNPAAAREASGLRLVGSGQPSRQQTQDPAAAREAGGLRVVLVGWGAIPRATDRLLRARGTRAEIVAVAVRDPTKPRSGLPPMALLLTRPQEQCRHR